MMDFIPTISLTMMNNIQFWTSGQGAMATAGQVIALPANGIRMALAMIGILPILILFPLLQKYLIRGVVIDAVRVR